MVTLGIEKRRIQLRALSVVGRTRKPALIRTICRKAKFGQNCEVRRLFTCRQTPGAALLFGEHCVLDNESTIEIRGALFLGDRVIFGYHYTVAAVDQIEIGDDCIPAELIMIRDHDHAFERTEHPLLGAGGPVGTSAVRAERVVGVRGDRAKGCDDR